LLGVIKCLKSLPAVVQFTDWPNFFQQTIFDVKKNLPVVNLRVKYVPVPVL
jgi:hypothetical protein